MQAGIWKKSDYRWLCKNEKEYTSISTILKQIIQFYYQLEK